MTPEDLQASIRAASGRYPAAASVTEELLQMAPALLGTQIRYLVTHHGEKFWTQADRLVGYARALGGSPAQALLEYTLAYLKEQARFLQSDEYSHHEFDDVLREVYGNPEVMERFYLEGLMLTHAYWPIHFDINAFFRSEFLARVPSHGVGAEYGFGHGLYLLETLTERPQTRACGFDISPYSQRYAARLLAHGGVAAERYTLGHADVRERLECETGAYAWAVFAEIIEHIPDPLFALRELRRCMAPGAPLFATTVINSNALDHLYLFRNIGEVRTLLREGGFETVAEKVLRVSDYSEGKARDPSIDVACVCIPDRMGHLS